MRSRWLRIAGLAGLLACEAARADRPSGAEPAPAAGGSGAATLATLVIGHVDAEVCFGDAQLAAEVRRRLPGIRVATGGQSATVSATVTVAVSARPGAQALSVAITKRSSASSEGSGSGAAGVVGERREVPLGASCGALLDAVASIAVRAVSPLEWHGAETPSRAHAATPPDETSSGAPSSSEGPSTESEATKGAEPVTPSVMKVQIGAGFRYDAAAGGQGSAPGGRFDAGVTWRRWAFLVAAIVDAPTSASTADASVSLRRWACFTEVGYVVPLPRGALRFGLGPLLDNWVTHAVGPKGYDDARATHGGLHTDAHYRVRLFSHVSLDAGVDLEAITTRDTFAAPGSTLARTTPNLWIAPRVGLGVDLF